MPPPQFVQILNDGDPSFWPFRFQAGELERLSPLEDDVVSVQDMQAVASYHCVLIGETCRQ